MEQKDTQGTPAQSEKPGKKQPTTLLWKLIYAAIGVVFAVGLYMVIRQEVLLPNPDFQAPTPPPPAETMPPPPETPAASIAPGAATPQAPTPTPAPTPRMEVPVEIYFERHKQQASIIAVGITEGNEMGSPDNAENAGWFYYGSSPGNPGNAILNGHRSYGGKSGVFSVLKKLKQGDRISVEFESGMLRFFEVDRVEEYKAADVPREYLTTGPDTPTQLTLITCLGDFGADGFSRSRVVAICHELTGLRQADDPVVQGYESMQ